ncbi:MAG: site-specific integrase [Alistipes sp.]
MATIRVKLRPSTVPRRDGTIYYQVCHRCKTQQITTTIHVPLERWSAEQQEIVRAETTESLRLAQCCIDSDRVLLQRIIQELEQVGNYEVRQVVERFWTSCHTASIGAFMKLQIEQLMASNQLGTARNYQRTMNSFLTYLGGVDLSFTAITEPLISDYNHFLIRRGVVRNTISFYMRILRSVYNKAVNQQLIAPSLLFQNIYTGIDRTRKRAVEEPIIAQLQRLDLRHSSALALARDLFVFSFCTRGMAFVDLAFLRISNLQNGMICYARHKTGQPLCVRIEPCAQRIIDRYARTTAPYLFPILTSEVQSKAYAQYQIALNYYNRLLKRLAALLGLEGGLSSYTARHSWATAARNHNVPLAVISAGLGHTSERTTLIYLTTLENSVIDTANEQILTDLNNVVSM